MQVTHPILGILIFNFTHLILVLLKKIFWSIKALSEFKEKHNVAGVY